MYTWTKISFKSVSFYSNRSVTSVQNLSVTNKKLVFEYSILHFNNALFQILDWYMHFINHFTIILVNIASKSFFFSVIWYFWWRFTKQYITFARIIELNWNFIHLLITFVGTIYKNLRSVLRTDHILWYFETRRVFLANPIYKIEFVK